MPNFQCVQVPEEASAVYNVLAIIENMIEVKPAVAEQAVEKTKVRIEWKCAGVFLLGGIWSAADVRMPRSRRWRRPRCAHRA